MLIAAVMLQASLAAPTFAPPTETPLRIITERSETAVGERHYRLERLIRFNREGSGYRVEVVVLGGTADAPQALGNLVERGLSALTGRTIVMHLDSAGHVSVIDGMTALWDRLCRGVVEAAASQASSPPAAPALAGKLADTLRALPPERQRALLATLVTAVITTEPVDALGVTTPVQLPGASPLGAPIMLEGTRQTTQAEPGLLRTRTSVSAPVDVPTREGAPASTGSVSLERIRTFDPRTGMIASALDTIHNLLGSGAAGRETLLVTRLRVAPARPEDWPR